ncbi:MAG: DNA translocase FtsK, partial [Candidatus Roizmanbacteria bacterium]|nr:DNA translocase FtsK [Candidatus Roizmanbacteria bacterium]
PYLTELEVGDVEKFLKYEEPIGQYTLEITEQSKARNGGMPGVSEGSSGDQDEYFEQAVELISQADKASASMFQRKLRVGYARAARILDELYEAGYVGPAQGSKPREIIMERFQQEPSE